MSPLLCHQVRDSRAGFLAYVVLFPASVKAVFYAAPTEKL